MKTSTQILLSIGLWALSVPAQAELPSVQLLAEVEPKQIYIGDPIGYKIKVTFSTSVVPMPLTTKQSFGDFELLKVQTSNPVPAGPKTSQTHQLWLTTFATGTVSIPPLTLYFTLADGKSAELQTDAVEIKVKSLLEEKGDIGGLAPLKGLFDFRSYAWIWITLGILAAIALGYLLYRRRKKHSKAEAAARKRPPDEIAWEALHQLESGDLLAQGHIKEFYSRLTTLLRAYLENRYGMSALDRTTAELLLSARQVNLNSEEIALLRTVFDNGDLVKFAKFSPNETDIDADVTRVKQFISITTPQETLEIAQEKIPV